MWLYIESKFESVKIVCEGLYDMIWSVMNLVNHTKADNRKKLVKILPFFQIVKVLEQQEGPVIECLET